MRDPASEEYEQCALCHNAADNTDRGLCDGCHTACFCNRCGVYAVPDIYGGCEKCGHQATHSIISVRQMAFIDNVVTMYKRLDKEQRTAFNRRDFKEEAAILNERRALHGMLSGAAMMFGITADDIMQGRHKR